MIVFENGYGRKRYQPVRCDGARLSYICAISYCMVDWVKDDDHQPRVFRRRWVAERRAALGSWLYRRAELKQIRPVTIR